MSNQGRESPMMTTESGVTAPRRSAHKSGVSLRVGAYPSERTRSSHATVTMPTITAAMAPIRPQGRSGIGRSKLEVDECIAISLSEEDCAGHDRPDAGEQPTRLLC